MVLSAVLACGPQQKNAPKEALRSQLQSYVQKGEILYGHQDDPSYGHTWRVENWETDSLLRSDVKAVSGQYPAVLGFDLGRIELGDSLNLDRVPFGLIRKATINHGKRGGVVTFSWHPRNPVTGGDAWDVSRTDAVSSLLEGGEKHAEYLEVLDRLASFFASLEGTPVIFRPWHENIGSWFWWGGALCTEEEYISLFRLTHDYLEKEKGLDNILWCYSPDSNASKEQYMSRYPGDDWVDILGVDCYEYVGSGTIEQAKAFYIEQVRDRLAFIQEISAERGKLMCLSETGFEGLPDPTWWTETLYPAIKGFPIVYVLTWRNADNMPGHFYAPWDGFEHAGNFKEFSELEDIILL